MKPSSSLLTPRAGWLGFLLLGAVSLLIQTLLIRESLFAFHGGEVGLGLFFAVWLGGIALGAWVGSVRVGSAAHHARGSRSFVSGLILLVMAGVFAVGLMRHYRLWAHLPVGGILPAGTYLLLLLGSAFPVGCLTGLLFPAGLSIWRIKPGPAYAWEALGSMAGGALTAYLALPRFGALEILAAAGVIVLLFAARGRPRWVAAGLALLLAASLATGLVGRLDESWLDRRFRGLETGSDATLHLDTPYHHVTLAERGGEPSLYIDGLYAGNVADAYVDSLQAALVAGVHPSPERTIVIAPAFCGAVGVLAGARGLSLHLFRLDERLDQAILGRSPSLAQRLADLRQAGRLHTGDPRDLLDGRAEQADLIAVLGIGPVNGTENRLYTREFFALCAGLLRPGGRLVLTLPGSANVASPWDVRMRAAVFAALQQVFGEVRILPGEEHLLVGARPRGRSHPEPSLVLTADSLSARRARAWPGGAPWPPAFFARLLTSDRQQSLQQAVERDAAGSSPNADRHPRAYYAQLRRWDHLAGGTLGGLLGWWHERPWTGTGALLLVLAGLALFVRRFWGQAALTISTTGFAGMGLDVIVLLLFQTYRGALYLKVGLVTGLFMVGLAIGAFLGHRLPSGRPRRTLAAADLLWIFLLLGAVLALPLLDRCSSAQCELLLLGSALAGGIITGLPFPAAARVWRLRRKEDPGRDPDAIRAWAGGAADAADHAGAILGGLLVGTFLIPLLGYAGALLCLLVVKTLSAAGALVDLSATDR